MSEIVTNLTKAIIVLACPSSAVNMDTEYADLIDKAKVVGVVPPTKGFRRWSRSVHTSDIPKEALIFSAPMLLPFTCCLLTLAPETMQEFVIPMAALLFWYSSNAVLLVQAAYDKQEIKRQIG